MKLRVPLKCGIDKSHLNMCASASILLNVECDYVIFMKLVKHNSQVLHKLLVEMKEGVGKILLCWSVYIYIYIMDLRWCQLKPAAHPGGNFLKFVYGKKNIIDSQFFFST